MNTETPETDAQHLQFAMGGFTLDFCRKLERERDEWKAKYIQQNKDLGCEMMDPNGTIWDYAKTLQRERDELKAKYAMHHAEAENLTKIIRAAKVLIAAKGRHNTMLAYYGLRDAIQSLTTQP